MHVMYCVTRGVPGGETDRRGRGRRLYRNKLPRREISVIYEWVQLKFHVQTSASCAMSYQRRAAMPKIRFIVIESTGAVPSGRLRRKYCNERSRDHL